MGFVCKQCYSSAVHVIKVSDLELKLICGNCDYTCELVHKKAYRMKLWVRFALRWNKFIDKVEKWLSQK